MPSKYLSSLLFALYVIFLISLVCAFRVVGSMSVAAILVTGFVSNRINNGSLYNKRMHNTLLIVCTIFYLITISGLLYTTNSENEWRHIQSKSALVVVPLAICCCSYLNSRIFKNLMVAFLLTLIAGTLYCLANAFVRYYLNGNDISPFFYHSLVSPFEHHAIQFSIIVFVAIVYLLEEVKKGSYFYNKALHTLLVLYFVLFILLLSSKLVIAFLIFYLLIYFVSSLAKPGTGRLTLLLAILGSLAVIAVVIATKNPISQRYREIMTDNTSVMQQQKFNPGKYFNGVEFRLLQWRFVKEILTENHAWIGGVSSGNSQQLLDQKYRSANMYIGNGKDNDQGFLGYDTHNEFLESTLQSGIIGLFAFFLICTGMIQMVIRRRNILLSLTTILLLLYTLNESVLESQFGLFTFLFFPLFLYYGTEPDNPPSPSA